MLRPLVDTLLQLESARAMDLAWARRKFKGYYHHYLEAPPIGQRFGILSPDYHFMVAHTRPLGTSMTSTIDSFRRDPILSLLLRRGGLNMLLATYMAIPADQRVISDIYEPAILGSTAGMVAANVLFGDYEVALELAGQLLTEGRLGARRGAGARADARYLSSR